MRKRSNPRANLRPVLRLEILETREVPAVLLQIDYTYDTGFFKNNPDARAMIERVARELGNSLNANLAAIAPGSGNTWTATFYNPVTGAQTSVANPTIPANTLKIYVGARVIPGAEGGFGGAGGYILSGSSTWNSATLTRGHNGYAPWGGSITFDSSDDYFFGQTTSGLTASKVDFYTVAMHEMGHLLGIGTSAQWNAKVSGASFVGASARSTYGQAIPLSPDRAHWADGVTVGGKPTVMDPILPRGTRVTWSSLDVAALRDLGWGATAIPSSPVVSPPPATSPPVTSPVVSPPPAPTPPPVVLPALKQPSTVAFASGSDGTLEVYTSEGGTLTSTGLRFAPFGGYRGELRIAGGDFDGDGITDYAVATGAGGPAALAVLSGKDGSYLVTPTLPFGGYSGGLYVAAGDIDRDGISELVVAAGQNAPPLVQTYGVRGGLQLQSSFIAFDAMGWRGGIRVAAGDINRDGFADVVVTTGSVVGAVSIYSGAGLQGGAATRLVADFLPFGALPVGLNVAVGDVDGDGYAEVALGLERGALPFVAVWSGQALSSGATDSPVAVLLALPVDLYGSRVAIRDLDGDGRGELVVAGGGAVGVARAFTFEQLQFGETGAVSIYPPVAGGSRGIFVG